MSWVKSKQERDAEVRKKAKDALDEVAANFFKDPEVQKILEDEKSSKPRRK